VAKSVETAKHWTAQFLTMIETLPHRHLYSTHKSNIMTNAE